MSLDEVAAAASVSKGGLLHHFPSKRALVLGIVEDMIRRYDKEIEAYRGKDPSPPGAYTRAYLRANLDCADESAQRCHALVSEMKMFAGSCEQFCEHSRACQEQLEHDGIDPVIASIVRYAGEGLTAALRGGMPRPSNYEQVVEALLRMARGEAVSPGSRAVVNRPSAKRKKN